MKRFALTIVLGCLGMAGLAPATATATDFSLKAHAPGPGHPRLTYYWNFNRAVWELSPPPKYDLSGGGELRLQKTDSPSLAAICRATTGPERDLLLKKDPKAQADYFLTQLPGGITDVKLESQQDNPLGFNGLTNFEVVYSYKLGGVKYRAAYMVSRAAAPVTPNQKPDPAAGEYFTALAVASEESQPDLYSALQRLLVTAKVIQGDKAPEDSDQFVSHGVMR